MFCPWIPIRGCHPVILEASDAMSVLWVELSVGSDNNRGRQPAKRRFQYQWENFPHDRAHCYYAPLDTLIPDSNTYISTVLGLIEKIEGWPAELNNPAKIISILSTINSRRSNSIRYKQCNTINSPVHRTVISWNQDIRADQAQQVLSHTSQVHVKYCNPNQDIEADEAYLHLKWVNHIVCSIKLRFMKGHVSNIRSLSCKKGSWQHCTLPKKSW